MSGAPGSTPANAPSPATGAPPPAATPAPAATPPSPSPAPAPSAAPQSPAELREGFMQAAKSAVQSFREKGSVPAVPAGADGAVPKPDQPKPDADPAKKAGEEDKPGEAKEGGEEEEPPFHLHPRWQKLRNEHRALTREMQAARPKAEEYDKIRSFMTEYDLSAEDVAEAYDILAKIRVDPQAALEALKPIYEQLLVRTGETLPDDLKKRVEEGYTDEATARELARQRAATLTAQGETKRYETRAEQGERFSASVAVQNAVASWDTQQASRDPDFGIKRPFVQDASKAIMAAEGIAKTPEQAHAILERALKLVEKNLSPFKPQPSATPPRPNGNGTPSTAAAVAAPTSIQEAAMQGLKGTYRYGA